MMKDYAQLDDETFDRILESILNDMTGAQLLAIPGIYEVVSEEFNNDVLDKWENEDS